jgi:hypothetical protein
VPRWSKNRTPEQCRSICRAVCFSLSLSVFFFLNIFSHCISVCFVSHCVVPKCLYMAHCTIDATCAQTFYLTTLRAGRGCSQIALVR